MSYLNLIPGYWTEFQKIVKQGPWRGPDQIIIQEFPMRIPEELSYQCTASSRSECKGLVRRVSTGSPQQLLTRTYTRSCKDLLEEFTRISTRASHKDFTSGAGIWKRVHAPQNLGLHFVWASATGMHILSCSLVSHFMREVTTKMPGPDGAPWCNPGLNTYRKSPGRVDTPEQRLGVSRRGHLLQLTLVRSHLVPAKAGQGNWTPSPWKTTLL